MLIKPCFQYNLSLRVSVNRNNTKKKKKMFTHSVGICMGTLPVKVWFYPEREIKSNFKCPKEQQLVPEEAESLHVWPWALPCPASHGNFQAKPCQLCPQPAQLFVLSLPNPFSMLAAPSGMRNPEQEKQKTKYNQLNPNRFETQSQRCPRAPTETVARVTSCC